MPPIPTLFLAVALAVVFGVAAHAQGAAEDNGYPPGLFENSPVVEPYKPSKTGRPAPTGRHKGAPRQAAGDAPASTCHHYRDWRYPYPQPC
jgi:hypothetical protein